MKHKLTAILLILTVTLTVAAPITKEMVKRFLTFSVTEVVGSTLVDQIWEEIFFNMTTAPEEIGKYNRSCELSTDRVYFQCRDQLFNTVGVSAGKGDDYDWDLYCESRAVVIARMKEYLHEGNNMQKLYEANKNHILSKLNGLDRKQRFAILWRLESAKSAFERFKTKDVQDRYEAWLAIKGDSRSHNIAGQQLIAKAQTAKEVGEIALSGALRYDEEADQKVFQEFVSDFNDHYLACYVGRRWKQGGDELLDKYINILRTIINDVRNYEG